MERGGSAAVTHGICQACRDELIRDVAVPLADFLDLIEEPVLLVTDGVEVEAGNAAAAGIVNRARRDLQGLLAGPVFECAYAKLPEGCGRTIHCSGCVIRRSVEHTHATGEPLYRVPATLRRGEVEDPHDVALLISTEKARDSVLLRIDAVGADS